MSNPEHIGTILARVMADLEKRAASEEPQPESGVRTSVPQAPKED